MKEEYSQQLYLVHRRMTKEASDRLKAEEDAKAAARAMADTSTRISTSASKDAAKAAININKKRIGELRRLSL